MSAPTGSPEGVAAEAGAGVAEAEEGGVRTHGQRLLLSLALDRIEARLERLLTETVASGDQVRALTGQLTAPAPATTLQDGLAELSAGVESLRQQVEEMAGTVTRLNRVQFKANALLDGKAQEVAQALAVLQEIATRREAGAQSEAAREAERRAALREEGRAALAADLVPVLDGIERALESGGVLLAERRGARSARPERPALWRFLRDALVGDAPSQDAADAGAFRLDGALAAWLDGLALGRERVLALLAGEDIRPIDALDRPFDPRLHVALATEERGDVPSGTVLHVLRPGYQRAGRPIRFAEVVVSRGPMAATPSVPPHDSHIRGRRSESGTDATRS